MKKRLNYILLFLVMGFTLPFCVNASVSTKISLSCDKLELKVNESTSCYVKLNSDGKLSQWYGKLNTGDGLTITSATSLNKNYKTILNGDSLVLSVIEDTAVRTNIIPSEGIIKLEDENIIKLNVTANKNINKINSTIELTSLKNCDDTLMGDIDADKDVDNDDAELSMKISNGDAEITNYHLSVGDFNFDNKITMDPDSMYILRLLNNKIDTSIYENMGDANGDGEVTEDDASYVLKVAVKKINLTDEEMNNLRSIADLNNDFQIDAKDALIILQLVNEKKETSDVFPKLDSKYLCYSVDSNTSTNVAKVNLKLINEVNVPSTGSTLSILLSVLSIGLIAIGFTFIFKTKKEQKQE